MLPENNFEFVITSSDYIFRKPMPHLFRVAIELSKLPPDEIWFCGDNTMADIMGAHSVGMFPVWFDFEAECPYPRYMTDTPECECLHIKNWSELVNYLKELT
jgi:putative hydrolase of the HAD superfamily